MILSMIKNGLTYLGVFHALPKLFQNSCFFGAKRSIMARIVSSLSRGSTTSLTISALYSGMQPLLQTSSNQCTVLKSRIKIFLDVLSGVYGRMASFVLKAYLTLRTASVNSEVVGALCEFGREVSTTQKRVSMLVLCLKKRRQHLYRHYSQSAYTERLGLVGLCRL